MTRRQTPLAEDPGQQPPRRLRLPISAALVAGFGGLMLVALTTVMAIGLGVAGRNTLELLVDKATLTLDLVTDRVESRMNPVRDQADFLAEEIANGTLSPERPTELARTLRLALAATPQVTGIAFTTPDFRTIRVGRLEGSLDTLIGDARTMESTEMLDRFMAESRGRRAPFWADPVWQPQLGTTIVPLVHPVWRDDRMIGVIGTGVSLGQLSGFLRELSVDAGTTAFLLYDRRHVIAHPAMADLQVGFEPPPDGPPLPRIEDIGDPVLAAILLEGREPDDQGPLADAAGITLIEPPGRGAPEHIVLLRPTPAYGSRPWQAGVLLERRDFADELQRFAAALAISLGVLLTGVVAALALGLPISRRVSRLAGAAGRLAELDFARTPTLPDSRFRELAEASASFNAMTRGLRWFEAYVPKALVLSLMRRHGAAGVPSELREVTVMFTDLRGFTPLTRDMGAVDTATLLNAHFGTLARAIEEEGGTVDKFIGDGLMAFWGAPEDQPDHAARALRAACAIARAAAEDNAARRSRGEPPLGLRVGLHSGPVVVGNIGAESRLNYTLVGETVNVAARIEELGRTVAPDDDVVALASTAVVEALPPAEGVICTPLGPCTLRGLSEPVQVWRVTVEA